MKPDFQALLNMVHAAEENERFIMSTWIAYGTKYSPSDNLNPCGTAACLVGTFCLKYPTDRLQLLTIPDFTHTVDRLFATLDGEESTNITEAAARRFNLTNNEAEWLFANSPLNDLGPRRNLSFDDASDLSKDRAINRLRKFIYFKLKQEEISEAWNERIHTKHAQCENQGHLAETRNYKEAITL